MPNTLRCICWNLESGSVCFDLSENEFGERIFRYLGHRLWIASLESVVNPFFGRLKDVIPRLFFRFKTIIGSFEAIGLRLSKFLGDSRSSFPKVCTWNFLSPPDD